MKKMKKLALKVNRRRLSYRDITSCFNGMISLITINSRERLVSDRCSISAILQYVWLKFIFSPILLRI